MWNSAEDEMLEDEVFLAGQRAQPGRYRLVEGRSRDVILVMEDVLPASLDGRVACYQRVAPTWGEISQSRGH